MSVQRIRGKDGVIIDSDDRFLELPKASTKTTTGDPQRGGMIRYNKGWSAFEGAIDLSDNTVEYRRFPTLDSDGKLSIGNLPDSITTGLSYKGTYNPISDDIDPPITAGVYDILPAPNNDATTGNIGNYYIIRGLMDSASKDLVANTPSTSPVIFTPVNPSGDGNWLQIKYYFLTSSSGTNYVSSAYGRIIKDQIPSTGHEGLASLAEDSSVTEEFSTGAEGYDPGLRDSDWVISTGTRWQSMRQNITSINAAAVLYDNSQMTEYNRPFSSTVTTAQTALDAITLEGLRRTGDAMYDNGGTGAGRFAAVYGTAAAPSITFNSNPYSSSDNTGLDPAEWSDNTTGLFHRPTVTGEFSASADSKEVQRWLKESLLYFPQSPTTEGYNGESKLTEIGFRPPFIDATNNSLGEDGMLAFSPGYNTLIQKISGKWKRISGSVTIDISALTEWVEAADGINYELTLTVDEPKSVQVQELLSDSSYEAVSVENMSIQTDKVILQVPMEPDMRFIGRCIVGV